ncbi:MAG: DUF4249 family protein [Bacteroidota bacterium]|nr:DUF4249 family protein [Bacteroidota bacterium]
MRLIKYILLIFLAGSLLRGCIEPYSPDDLEYEQMLFIEARITDEPGVIPCVLFKHASSFSGRDPWDEYVEPVINTSEATIYIENTLGQRWYFTEQHSSWPFSMSGYYYYLTGTDFTLREGESYMLYIETQDGYIFESQYEKYLPSPPVEEITYNYETWETDETGEATDGYRFYISSSSEGEDPLYLRWSLDATYSYMVPYIASYYWINSALVDSTNDGLRLCYMDENIKGIFTGTSEGMAVNRVANAPLHGVSRFGDRLQIKYSLHVKQIRIPSSTYRFWNELKSLLYETGGLYETVPFRLRGNISCVSHDNISVTGLFEVAGVSETRVFVPRPGEFRVVTHRYVSDTIAIFEWNQLPAEAWIMGEPPDLVTADVECFDCTAKGGYTKTPAFWEK